MQPPDLPAVPDLATLLDLFPGTLTPADCEPVAAADVPEPYHQLLVHEHHMTVTVEAFHGSPVNVRVLRRRHDPPWYAREILLALQSDGRVVQYGLPRINLDQCSAAVRADILREGTPLGRILINHDVLRRIELKALLRVRTPPGLAALFGTDRPTYGRLAIIHYDGKPAVQLLEIVTPACAPPR
jgi:chorismate-pyruvate lyase